MGLFTRDLGTGLDHDWERCERRRCGEPLCQVYWAGFADGQSSGYDAGYQQGAIDGYARGDADGTARAQAAAQTGY